MFEIHVKITDEKIIEYLQTKKNISIFIREVINDLISGKLNYSEKNIETEIKKVKLQKLKAEVRIKEFEANQIEKYGEVFGKSPSYQGHKAIKERANVEFSSSNQTTFRELTEEELNQFAKLMSLEQIDEGYKTVCLICKLKLEFSERTDAILEANRHLLAVHGKKFLK